jgi:hypothetical protein
MHGEEFYGRDRNSWKHKWSDEPNVFFWNWSRKISDEHLRQAARTYYKDTTKLS